MAKSQKENILQHLKKRKTITPIEALNLYGCFRLAAVICVLRNEGYDIKTIMIDDGQKRYAEYFLKGDESYA